VARYTLAETAASFTNSLPCCFKALLDDLKYLYGSPHEATVLSKAGVAPRPRERLEDLIRIAAVIAWMKDPSSEYWSRALLSRKLGYQFERFADYLRDGTLKPVMTELEGDVAPNEPNTAPVYSYGLHEDHEPYDDYDPAEDERLLLLQEAHRDMEAWSRFRD
jgi:hypothetical protein